MLIFSSFIIFSGMLIGPMISVSLEKIQNIFHFCQLKLKKGAFDGIR